MILTIDNERSRATLLRRFGLRFGGCFATALAQAPAAGDSVPLEISR
jgi:hypothetical protein